MACVREYRGKLVVDWRDSNRKRHLDPVADEAEGLRRLAEIAENDRKAPTNQSFRDYGQWWLGNVAKNSVKASTYEEYERALRVHLYPAFGDTPFSKLERKKVRELITAKQNDGLSQSSIRNIIAPMRAMYETAIEDEQFHKKNPARKVGKFNKKKQALEGDKKKINPLTSGDVTIMLKKCLEIMPHWYPLFLCAPRTGIREGELISLKGTDIDLVNGFINVQRNLSRGEITPTKSGRERRVDMSKQLASILDEMLSARRSKALELEMKKPADERRDAATVVNEVMEGWLFTTPETIAKSGKIVRGGTQMDPSNVRKVFNKLLTAAKLPRVRFHDLRHTFATLLIQNKESLAYVRDQLGHYSIQITVDTYGHLVPGGNRSAVDALDDDAPSNTEQSKAA